MDEIDVENFKQSANINASKLQREIQDLCLSSSEVDITSEILETLAKSKEGIENYSNLLSLHENTSPSSGGGMKNTISSPVKFVKGSSGKILTPGGSIEVGNVLPSINPGLFFHVLQSIKTSDPLLCRALGYHPLLAPPAPPSVLLPFLNNLSEMSPHLPKSPLKKSFSEPSPHENSNQGVNNNASIEIMALENDAYLTNIANFMERVINVSPAQQLQEILLLVDCLLCTPSNFGKLPIAKSVDKLESSFGFGDNKSSDVKEGFNDNSISPRDAASRILNVISRISLNYISLYKPVADSSYVSNLTSSLVIRPGPLTFLLLHSLIAQVLSHISNAEIETISGDIENSELATYCNIATYLLNILRGNFKYMIVNEIPPATVGLGHSTTSSLGSGTPIKGSSSSDSTFVLRLCVLNIKFFDLKKNLIFTKLITSVCLLWADAIRFFYPEHNQRVKLLISLLGDVEKKHENYRDIQLSVLCNVLAQPYFLKHFQNENSLEIKEEEKLNTELLKWSAESFRELVNSGEITMRIALSYIIKESSPVWLAQNNMAAIDEDSLLKQQTKESLIRLYDKLCRWKTTSRKEAHIDVDYEKYSVFSIIQAILKSIRNVTPEYHSLPLISMPPSSEVSLPSPNLDSNNEDGVISPSVEEEKEDDRDGEDYDEMDEEAALMKALELSMKMEEDKSNPLKVTAVETTKSVVTKEIEDEYPLLSIPTYISRVLLLRSLQNSFFGNVFNEVKVASASSSVLFDKSKCSSSITLSDDLHVATQSHEKVWGSVLCSQKCPVSSGIHTWEIDIRKCQKGHIFIGMCTSEAGISTYLGGDSHGWGLIGTKALWHNRSKIKSGYGKKFHDGDVIRMTLDSDAGSLSFGDREGDWGIAHSGLPSNEKNLFPCISLYQANDAVSIKKITDNPTKSSFNFQLTEQLVSYSKILFSSCESLIENLINSKEISSSSISSLIRNPTIQTLLMPLVCSLSLHSSIQISCALNLFPCALPLLKLLDKLNILLARESKGSNGGAFLYYCTTGRWLIESSACGSIPAQKYILALTQSETSISGEGIAPHDAKAKVTGKIVNNLIDLEEIWDSGGGSCKISAKISLTGCSFDGTFKDSLTNNSADVYGKLENTYTLHPQFLIGRLTTLLGNFAGKLAHSIIVVDQVLTLEDIDNNDNVGEHTVIEEGEEEEGEENLIHSRDEGGDEDDEEEGHDDDEEGKSQSFFSDSEGKKQEGGDNNNNNNDSTISKWLSHRLFKSGLNNVDIDSELLTIAYKLLNVNKGDRDDFKKDLQKLSNSIGHDYPVFNAILNAKDLFSPTTSPELTYGETPTKSTSTSTALYSALSLEIFDQFVNGHESALVIDKWVMLFVPSSPFLKLGGDIMQRARRAAIAVMLYHCGYAKEIQNFLSRGVPKSRDDDVEVKPDSIILQIWSSANRVIGWSNFEKRQKDKTYDFLGTQIINRMKFLLNIRPVFTPYQDPQLAQLDIGPPAILSPSTTIRKEKLAKISNTLSKNDAATLNPEAEVLYDNILRGICSFAESNDSLVKIRSSMVLASCKALLKAIGLSTFSAILGGVSSNSNLTKQKLTLSSAKIAVISWLTPALFGQKSLVVPSSQEISLNSPFSFTGVTTPSQNNNGGGGYYMNGLQSCGSELSFEVKSSFQRLFRVLAGELQQAALGNNVNLQFTLLETWGIIIRPDDHDFLSNVGIFRILQTVLENAQLSSSSAHRNLIHAALKVTHLLATQIAYDDGEQEDELIRKGDVSSGYPLDRKPSGPVTLGKSVFDMLYGELCNSLQAILESDAYKGIEKKKALPSNSKSKSRAPSISVTEVQADDYGFKILNLLYSVSATHVCQRYLTSSRWLQLLLKFVVIGTIRIQRRVARLLRRLLLGVEPNNFQLRVSDLKFLNPKKISESYFNEYDDKSSSLIFESTDFVQWLLELIGSTLPVSTVTVSNESNEKEIESVLDAQNAFPLAAELVSLVRSLMQIPSWLKIINSVILESLTLVPSSLISVGNDVPNENGSDKNWKAMSSALASISIIGGHIDGLRIGGAVRIMKRGSSLGASSSRSDRRHSSINDLGSQALVNKNGIRASVACYDPAQTVAQVYVVVHLDEKENSSKSVLKVLNVNVDDLRVVPEIEVNISKISNEVSTSLITNALQCLLTSGSTIDMDEDGVSKLSEAEAEIQVYKDLLKVHALKSAGTLIARKNFIQSLASVNESGGPSTLLKTIVNLAIIETPTNDLASLSDLNDSLLLLWARWYTIQREKIKNSAKKSRTESRSDSVDVDITGLPVTFDKKAVSELPPSPECILMMDMGLQRSWCEFALNRSHGDVQAAIEFCIVNRSLLESIPSDATPSTASIRPQVPRVNPLVGQLSEMGFPKAWCERALRETGNDMGAALTWLLSNGDSLVDEEEKVEESKTSTAAEDSLTISAVPTSSITPGEKGEEKEKVTEGVEKPTLKCFGVREVSGFAEIFPDGTIKGKNEGGFCSVGARSLLLSHGKWYYEAILKSGGCMQIGWVDIGFSGSAAKGDGVGDCTHSWSYDGYRKFKWHNGSTNWGAKWKEGDIVGCAVDLDTNMMMFSLNGNWGDGMGVAFSNFRFEKGIFPCASLNKTECMQFNFGTAGNAWGFSPPDKDYRPVQEAYALNRLNCPGVGIDEEDVAALEFIEDMLEDESCDDISSNQYFPNPHTSSIMSNDVGGLLQKLMMKSSIRRDELGQFEKLQQALRDEKDKLRKLKHGSESSKTINNRAQVTAALLHVTEEELLKTIHDTSNYLIILYSRHILFTLLSKWPQTNLGKFSLKSLGLDVTNEMKVSFLHRFLKLVAARCYMTGNDRGESSESSDITLSPTLSSILTNGELWETSNHDIMDSLEKSPFSRLQMLTPVLLMALDGDKGELVGVTKVLIKCIAKEIRNSTDRLYAQVNWDSLEDSIPIGLIEIAERNCWTDSEALLRPNILLAEFLTSLFLPTAGILKDGKASSTSVAIFDIWAVALRSCNITLKTKAFKFLGGILLELISYSSKQGEPLNDEVLKEFLRRIPLDRILALTKRRISKERGDHPIVSLYMQSMVEFVSILNAITHTNTPESLSSPEVIENQTVHNVTHDWFFGQEIGIPCDTNAITLSGTLVQNPVCVGPKSDFPEMVAGLRVVRGPNWQWNNQDGGEGTLGTVEGITSWSNVEGEGVSIRWDGGNCYNYRWGGEGCFDVTIVEIDEVTKEIKKRYDAISSETFNGEGSFGRKLNLGILLRVNASPPPFFDATKKSEITPFYGTIEWPDYGARAVIEGLWCGDGSMQFEETYLLDGGAETGWMTRFNSENWRKGIIYKATFNMDSEEWQGTFSFKTTIKDEEVVVNGIFYLNSNLLFTLDENACGAALSITDSGMSVECKKNSNENVALGTVGFQSGIHYWEVRIQNSTEVGSVFIGVSEKPGIPGGNISSRLTRWNGYGFVNCRASIFSRTQRIYGEFFNTGDTIGVLLNMETGKLSFFLDGRKFGEHIVVDLGVAFNGLRGDSSGKRVRTLYPAIGLKRSKDKICLTRKWISTPVIPSERFLSDAAEVTYLLQSWTTLTLPKMFPASFLMDAFANWKRWKANKWKRYMTRAGVFIDIDTSKEACLSVCRELSSPYFAGDKVKILMSGDAPLDVSEEAVILGAHKGFLWYKVEAGSAQGPVEGASYAWYFTQYEMEMLEVGARAPENNIKLSKADISIEEFKSLATCSEIPWKYSLDLQLVEAVNKSCDSAGTSSENISYDQLDLYLQTDSFSGLPLNVLHARISLLYVLNHRLGAVLPFFNLKVPEELGSRNQPLFNFISSLHMHESLINPHYLSSTKMWKVPSVGKLLRLHRGLMFSSTKRTFFDSILTSTTTPTSLSPDEYEDPKEIKTIRINRIRAHPSKLVAISDKDIRLQRSVLGQLYHDLQSWPAHYFRRAYVGKGHGGQKRCFILKFVGEGVNDYGGPYREMFEAIVDEIQSDSLIINLLLPCNNRVTNTGLVGRDKFVLNPTFFKAAKGMQLLVFLGKLIGTAVRHGITLGLNLPKLIWSPLVHASLRRSDISEIDESFTTKLNEIERLNESITCDDEELFAEALSDLKFNITLSGGSTVNLKANGSVENVTLNNRLEYVWLAEQFRASESAGSLFALFKGLSSVIPVDIFPLFSPIELEELLCGRASLDIDLLKQNTEYEGVDPLSNYIQYFWKVLQEMSAEQRTLFLRFVSSRSRLPTNSNNACSFKIQPGEGKNVEENPDSYLPRCKSCFFSLQLPAYSSVEVMREKLMYAITHTPNMDADVVLHSGEGYEN